MKRKNLNTNYSNRFGAGLVMALLFVIVIFNLSFDVHSTKILEIGDIEMSNYLPIDSRQIKEEKKMKLDKKVAIKAANKKLLEEIEFKDEIEPDPVATKTEAISTGNDFAKASPKVTPSERPAPKVIPKKKKEKHKPFLIVSQMPRFGDCEVESNKGHLSKCTTDNLLRFIYKNIKYPALARESQIEGRVIVKFIINASGAVKNIEILREPGGGLGAEAKRVLKLLPDWLPGRQQGEAVSVQYTMPIVFKLE